ncbi:hypothetical protein [Actinomadura rudentiformis]|uniref:Secreted protein n=1 Tax=Actinomadura rudentiformis TaxID=359158 RepID=A0A6H9YLU9_9ACTN|nr:hypothetical protein [Actinomadura rudentiformis]KAB2342997.1 hypothetical protein F8566_36185 [Actinomadura rudentiformis]
MKLYKLASAGMAAVAVVGIAQPVNAAARSSEQAVPVAGAVAAAATEAEAARRCNIVAGAPFKAGRRIKANVKSTGCNATWVHTASLWRHRAWGWQRLGGQQRWVGGKFKTVNIPCDRRTTYTYKTHILSKQGGSLLHTWSRPIRIRCS